MWKIEKFNIGVNMVARWNFCKSEHFQNACAKKKKKKRKLDYTSSLHGLLHTNVNNEWSKFSAPRSLLASPNLKTVGPVAHILFYLYFQTIQVIRKY